MKRILSLDGGGAFGLFQAIIADAIERTVDRPLREVIDLFVGTSTGGIIAAGAAGPIPHAAREIVDLYVGHLHHVFGGWPAPPRLRDPAKERWRPPPSGNRARHDPAPLRGLLQDHLGFRPMREAKTPLAVTVYDLRQPGALVLASWRDPGAYTPIWEAVMGTAAQPLVFPEHENWIDGGVYAASPALLARALAAELWPDEQLLLVSLGSGQGKETPITRGWATNGSISRRIRTYIRINLDGQADSVDEALLYDRSIHYFRFQPSLSPELAELDVDDGRPRAVQAIKAAAEAFVAAERARITELARQL